MKIIRFINANKPFFFFFYFKDEIENHLLFQGSIITTRINNTFGISTYAHYKHFPQNVNMHTEVMFAKLADC